MKAAILCNGINWTINIKHFIYIYIYSSKSLDVVQSLYLYRFIRTFLTKAACCWNNYIYIYIKYSLLAEIVQ